MEEDVFNYTNSTTMDYNADDFVTKGTRTIIDDNLTMLWWVQMAWTTVFAFMIIVAIGGNCIVIWIVTAHKRMRTVTNYFLVNLSTADLLLSSLNCFFNFIYMMQRNWQFGSLYCIINNFISYMTVAASVFTLTAISCDRYLAIVHPLQPRMSKTISILVIMLIWIMSMVLATPCILYSSTVTYKFGANVQVACILIWPDGQPTISQMDFAYQIVFLVITYIVPMVLMICCYTGMGVVLWGSRSIGEQTERQADSIKSKRKVVRMFIFIVVVFGLCWLPYHAYFIYTHFDREILYWKYVQHVYLAFYWFAMANAMVNPLIYYWMNARFRKYFQMVICCCRYIFGKHTKNRRSDTLNGKSFSKSGAEEEWKISLKSLKAKRNNTVSTKIPNGGQRGRTASGRSVGFTEKKSVNATEV